jgi:hypothetical protein
MAGDIFHFAEAFFLELCVADRQDLVHGLGRASRVECRVRRERERERAIRPSVCCVTRERKKLHRVHEGALDFFEHDDAKEQ